MKGFKAMGSIVRTKAGFVRTGGHINGDFIKAKGKGIRQTSVLM